MKTSNAQFVFLICLCILLFALASNGQTVCQSDSRQADVIKAVQLVKLDTESTVLTPEPELRDDFISFERDFTGQPLLADFCFYVFTPTMYRLNGNEVSATTVHFDDEDKDESLYVASTSKAVYLLHGFESSPLGFNRLMLDLHVKVDSTDKVMRIFNFYSKVVYGKVFRSKIIGDDLQLIAVAAEDFRLRYSASVCKSAGNVDSGAEKNEGAGIALHGPIIAARIGANVNDPVHG